MLGIAGAMFTACGDEPEVTKEETTPLELSKIRYSRYYGGMYVQAYRLDMGEERTFKISRIMSVNGHSFSRIHWNQIGDDFKKIY